MATPSTMVSAPAGASPADDISPALLPVVALLSSTLTYLTNWFNSIPGSPILLRYIRSSYQNDPWRSLLEVLLVAFALRTLLARRTRGEGEGKGLRLSEKVSGGVEQQGGGCLCKRERAALTRCAGD